MIEQIYIQNILKKFPLDLVGGSFDLGKIIQKNELGHIEKTIGIQASFTNYYGESFIYNFPIQTKIEKYFDIEFFAKKRGIKILNGLYYHLSTYLDKKLEKEKSKVRFLNNSEIFKK